MNSAEIMDNQLSTWPDSHYFHLKVVLFCEICKEGMAGRTEGRTDGRTDTPCENSGHHQLTVTAGRPRGSM